MNSRNHEFFLVRIYDDSQSNEQCPVSVHVAPAIYEEYEAGKLTKAEAIGVPVELGSFVGFSPCRLYVNSTTGQVHLESGSCGAAIKPGEAKNIGRDWKASGEFSVGFPKTRVRLVPFTRESLVSWLSPYSQGGGDVLLDADNIEFAGRITFHHVHNDHTSRLRIHSIGIWESPYGESIPVGVYTDASYFCINEVYRKEGRLHLSRRSVGPTVRGVEVTERWIQGHPLVVEVCGGVGTLRQATREEIAGIGERITKKYITKCVHEFRDRMAELKYSGEEYDKVAREWHEFRSKHRNEWSDVIGEAFNSWLPPEEKAAGLTKSIAQMTGEEFNAWKHENPTAWIILRRAYGLG